MAAEVWEDFDELWDGLDPAKEGSSMSENGGIQSDISLKNTYALRFTWKTEERGIANARMDSGKGDID